MMTPDNIKAIFQGVMALVIVVGGGAFAFLRPDNSQAVWGIVGTVVAYYFLSATQANAVRATVQMMSQSQNAPTFKNTTSTKP
jgi:hypothetical protein